MLSEAWLKWLCWAAGTQAPQAVQYQSRLCACTGRNKALLRQCLYLCYLTSVCISLSKRRKCRPEPPHPGTAKCTSEGAASETSDRRPTTPRCACTTEKMLFVPSHGRATSGEAAALRAPAKVRTHAELPTPSCQHRRHPNGYAKGMSMKLDETSVAYMSPRPPLQCSAANQGPKAALSCSKQLTAAAYFDSAGAEDAAVS